MDVILRRTDIIDRERRAAQETQAFLIAELNHRVKNILALIRSLIRQSRQGARSVDAFADDLERRVRALAVAHDQLNLSHWDGAPLRTLIAAEARAWADPTDRVTLSGPAVTLGSRAYQALALVMHELMTNAAKYGALSAAPGRVEVTWVRDPARDLRIEWRESDGPIVRAPERRGFGTVIVEQIVPFELGGQARVEYRPEGVHAHFVIPADQVSDGVGDADAADAVEGPRRADHALQIARLLLVEDSMMIALDAQAMLSGEGLTVEVAGTVADARRVLASEHRFDAAVLDINLSGERSFELADDLVRRAVPFVFATGYGESTRLPERFRAVPLVSKPYDGTALKAALRVVIDEVGRRGPDRAVGVERTVRGHDDR